MSKEYDTNDYSWTVALGLITLVLVVFVLYLFNKDPDVTYEFQERYGNPECIPGRCPEANITLQNQHEDYTCEQIKIMIEAGSYPPSIKIETAPDGRWISTTTDPNTKDGFVTYYITNCLEQKNEL